MGNAHGQGSDCLHLLRLEELIFEVCLLLLPPLAFGDVLQKNHKPPAILASLVRTAQALGITLPKVAVLSASEVVMPKLRSSAEAALMSKMAERGQIKGALVDGPMALDGALDPESARIKGMGGPVAGDADCLLFPFLEAGNTFYKAGTKLGGAEVAAVVAGARVPCVLSSRGDSAKTKLSSIALAALLA